MRSMIPLMIAAALLSACGSKTDDRLKALEERLARIETKVNQHDAVILKPGGRGYGLLQTDLGRVAVAIADIQPAAGGSRVLLDFGNPTAARLTGMRARIEWGGSDGKGLPLAGNVQGMDFTAPDPLPAGAWRQYPVQLAGVPPEKLGWIRISGFDTGTVDLLSR